MIRYFWFFILSVLMSFSLSAQAAETYKLDPMHSYVIWYIKHLDFTTQSGKWYAEGTLTLDKDKPQDTKVDVTIPVGNIVTGLPELDQHLKGKLFFDVQQFPMATFVSNKVVVTGKDTAKVTGMLTLHGVSKPVTLNVKFNHAGINPITNKMTAGFSGNTTLKRSDFGMNTLLPAVGDDVKINIEVEAYKDDKQG